MSSFLKPNRGMTKMSKKYNKVKKFYDDGLWTKEQVGNAVIKEWITAEEYEMITGEIYE